MKRRQSLCVTSLLGLGEKQGCWARAVIRAGRCCVLTWRLAPTPGRSASTWMPCSASVAAAPTPESCRMCGVCTAPAHMSTSPPGASSAVKRSPSVLSAVENSTPTALGCCCCDDLSKCTLVVRALVTTCGAVARKGGVRETLPRGGLAAPRWW